MPSQSQELAKKYPALSFTHISPGFIDTNIMKTSIATRIMGVVFSPLMTSTAVSFPLFMPSPLPAVISLLRAFSFTRIVPSGWLEHYMIPHSPKGPTISTITRTPSPPRSSTSTKRIRRPSMITSWRFPPSFEDIEVLHRFRIAFRPLPASSHVLV